MSNENLIEYYRKTWEHYEKNANYAWETIRLHTILSSSIISITIGTLSLLLTSETFQNQHLLLQIVLIASISILPVLMWELLTIGKKNFERECTRMYEELAIMMKLEEQLKINVERERGYIQFPEDKTYKPKRYFTLWNNTESFIENMMNVDKENFYSRMSKLFNIFIMFAYVLLIIIASIIVIQVITVL